MSPKNNITNEDLLGLYPVNVNALVENFKKYGKGNRNKSPNIRSPRLNNLPKMRGFRFNNSYEEEEPVYVPKMKLGTLKMRGGRRLTRRRMTRRFKARRT